LSPSGEMKFDSESMPLNSYPFTEKRCMDEYFGKETPGTMSGVCLFITAYPTR